jgi:hypothetical protein
VISITYTLTSCGLPFRYLIDFDGNQLNNTCSSRPIVPQSTSAYDVCAAPKSGIGFTGLPGLRPRKNARPEFQAAMDTSVKANDDPLAKIAWLRAPQCTFDLSAAP